MHERLNFDLTQLSTSVLNSKHLSLQLGVPTSGLRSYDLDMFISLAVLRIKNPRNILGQILSNDPKTQQAPHRPFEEGLQECRKESADRPRKNQSAPATAAPAKLQDP